MVEFRKPFRCEVLTPRGRAFAGELVSAVFPAPDGLVGVLSGRGPMLVLLGSGPATLREPSGVTSAFFVAGGFARFEDNALTLLPEEFVPIDQIDPEAAWQEIEHAQGLPQDTPEQIEIRQEALKAARDRFNLAQKHRKETGEV